MKVRECSDLIFTFRSDVMTLLGELRVSQP
jgi:hypothetical protein